jgi:hypothetical protein
MARTNGNGNRASKYTLTHRRCPTPQIPHLAPQSAWDASCSRYPLVSHVFPPAVYDPVCTPTVAVVVDDSSAGSGVAESKGGDGEAGGPSQELPDPNYVPEVRLDWTLTASDTRVYVPDFFPPADSGPIKAFQYTFSVQLTLRRATYPTQLTSADVLPVR